MSSEVKTRNAAFMESQSGNESLQARIREIEDENQELRAQTLIQNRTIVELRNELVLLRIQISEMSDTSALLRERVRNLSQNVQQQQENEGRIGQITAPPLMAPPPVPPPLPPARIRIAPRQVGAGEALTTPLGVSLSSPPRHRVKRDCRQGFYRSTRCPYRRLETTEPGPSTSPTPFLSAERPNYFVGLRIIPRFQTSFVCSQNQSSGYSDSASDSSGSDDNPQLIKKLNQRSNEEPVLKKVLPDFELLKNVGNLHHPKVRQTILQNYNLSVSNPASKFFFPLPWESTPGETPTTLPSTSGNEFGFSNSGTSNGVHDGVRTASKISDCVQYTFPAIHEGLHHGGVHSVVTNTGQPSRLRKFKKNIPYLRPEGVKILDETKKQMEKEEDLTKLVDQKNRKKIELTTFGVESESLSSIDDSGRPRLPPTVFLGELSSDIEQDGFQADESSNCMTSNENSLEKVCISESNMMKKK